MSALRLDVAVGGDATGYNRAMSGLGKTASSSLGGLKGMIAGAFTVGAITAFAKKTIEFAGHVTDLSNRLGVSAEYLQEMQFVMKQNGGSVDDLTVLFEKLGDAREKALSGDIGAMEDFAKLGVSNQDLETKNKEDLLGSIAKSFEGGTSEAMTNAFKSVGGKGAGALVASFVDGLEDGKKKARDSGAIMDDETRMKLDEAGDAFDRLSIIMMTSFAPAFVLVANIITRVMTTIKANGAALGAFYENFNLLEIIKAAVTPGKSSVLESAEQFANASNASDDAYREVVQEGENKMEAARVAREDKAAARKNAPKENYAAAAEAAAVKDIAKLETDISAEKERGAMIGISEDERRVMLAEKLLRAKDALANIHIGEGTESEILAGNLEVARAENALKGVSQAKAVGAPAFSDSLTSVGNFLGAGRASGLESIAQNHFNEAKKQTVFLDKIANKKTEGTIFVPAS